MKLKDIEIKEIMRLIKKNKIKKLIAKEYELGTKIRWQEIKSDHKSAAKMNYIDKIEPKPTFGELCYYQIRAIKDHSTSLPAELSVIFLDRSK